MNFSGVSKRSLPGRLLRVPLRLIPQQAIVPVLQGKLRGAKWIVGSHTHGCWLGSYESEKQRLFAQTIPPGSKVFDLGGHVGFYTLLATRSVGPTGAVYVFEPLPRNLVYLRKHLSLNHSDNVTVMEAAVADHGGVATFVEGPDNSMGHLATAEGFQVNVVALDDLVAAGQLPAPDIMKLDIEGAEYLALVGARLVLQDFTPPYFLRRMGKRLLRHAIACWRRSTMRFDRLTACPCRRAASSWRRTDARPGSDLLERAARQCGSCALRQSQAASEAGARQFCRLSRHLLCHRRDAGSRHCHRGFDRPIVGTRG